VSHRVALVSMVLCVMVTAICFGAPFEFYRTGWSVALFQNVTTEAFSGLWVKFSDSVQPLQTLGIGANVTLASNDAGVLLFKGTVPPLTALEIDWPLSGPTIAEAAWIREDGTRVAIQVHAPMARMVVSRRSSRSPAPMGRLCHSSPSVHPSPRGGRQTLMGLRSRATSGRGVTESRPKAMKWSANSTHPAATR